MSEARGEVYVGGSSRGYTVMDFAYLAVVAVVSGIIFFFTWNVYEAAKAIGGPVFARLVSYGLWFIGGPLGASLVRKPGSAFLGETLGALVESFIPTAGGFTNLIYGAAQGALSELVYLATGYRRFDPLIGGLAGAAAAPAAIALDAILFQEIATPALMTAWIVAAAVGGFIYGAVAAAVASRLREEV